MPIDQIFPGSCGQKKHYYFQSDVDKVKEKFKESSDIHLKLLDIKSEEDLEYENLRKNFQFVEEKLYEVDSLIFEK